jgi:hypothetical protein
MYGSAKCLELFSQASGSNEHTPHWTSVRNWLLRIGLAPLLIPIERADDWVWKVDCSIQIGTRKCLVIVGVRLSAISPKTSLTFQDMRLIGLHVLESAKKEDVERRLNAECVRHGAPTAIIDDHGAEIWGGVRLLQQKNPTIREFYDPKHKAACLLKALLLHSATWKDFQHQLGQCKFASQQTLVGYATAPSQRSKARFMNLEPLVRWAIAILYRLDKPISKKSTPEQEAFQKHFQWLLPFRAEIAQWNGWLQAIKETTRTIAVDRLSETSVDQLEERLKAIPCSNPIASQLIAFLREETKKLLPNEKMSVSTEILESCFGKLKHIERTQSTSGFTSLVLSLGAMLAPLTVENIQQSLEAVKQKDVANWAKQAIGKTLQSARKAVLGIGSRRATKTQ